MKIQHIQDKWFCTGSYAVSMPFLNLLRSILSDLAGLIGAKCWSLMLTQQLLTESYCMQPEKKDLLDFTTGFRTSPEKQFHLILQLAPAVVPKD